MGAVAGIASAVLGSTAKSGQQGALSSTNASQSSAISNAQNSKPRFFNLFGSFISFSLCARL